MFFCLCDFLRVGINIHIDIEWVIIENWSQKKIKQAQNLVKE